MPQCVAKTSLTAERQMDERWLQRAAGLLKPVMHLYWQLSRGMTLGVRCAAIGNSEDICLVRHTYVEGWSLPGGGVDVGETIYDAAEREMREETGIALTGAPRLFGLYANPTASPSDHVALVVSHNWAIVENRQPDYEIAEVAHFPMDRLPPDTAPGTQRRIRELQSGSLAAHIW